jgi:hypothetical protein
MSQVDVEKYGVWLAVVLLAAMFVACGIPIGMLIAHYDEQKRVEMASKFHVPVVSLISKERWDVSDSPDSRGYLSRARCASRNITVVWKCDDPEKYTGLMRCLNSPVEESEQ